MAFTVIDRRAQRVRDLQRAIRKGWIERTVREPSPKVNPSAGRDHWGRAMCVNMGGGGVKTGMIIGKTNDRAEEPVERPIQVAELVEHTAEFRETVCQQGVQLDRLPHSSDSPPRVVHFAECQALLVHLEGPVSGREGHRLGSQCSCGAWGEEGIGRS